MRLACAPGTQARGSRYIRRTKLRFIGHNKIEPHVHIEPNSWLLSFQLRHGLLEQLTIQVENHRHDVGALECAQKAACQTHMQVTVIEYSAYSEQEVVRARDCRRETRVLER